MCETVKIICSITTYFLFNNKNKLIIGVFKFKHCSKRTVFSCNDFLLIKGIKGIKYQRNTHFSFCWECLSVSSMASPAPPSSATGVQNPKKSLGFVANAIKRKDSFIQFFAMTGILLLSVRSLGQKYRIHDLQEDTSALKEEQQTLTERMKNIKHTLLHEASLEPSGLFAARLRRLFADQE